jgi:lipopolysaccharide/colanic/teichoic acid biosynthesis glycosyltransferase
LELHVGHGEESSVYPAALAGPRHRASSRVSHLERGLDLTLLLLASPLILLLAACIAIAIYLDSPGPVIFRSTRVGRDGQPFEMFKFRKMRLDSAGHPLTLADDERFTPIGRFLAGTRLDELPQVINVLRGEMRLVGPRPELEYFVAQFREAYGEILTVTPGITGISQLRFVDEHHLLHGPDPVSAYRERVLPAKIEMDLAYTRCRTLIGDLVILARTVALPVALLARRGRWAIVRSWLPTAAFAGGLTVAFILAASRLG